MTMLSTLRVEDWPVFLKTHGIDLDGRWPSGSVVYDTGYQVTGNFPHEPYPGTIAFTHERRIWLTTCGELKNAIPFLAMAWITLFPTCQWLPEQFGDAASVPDFYALLPSEDAAKLVAKLRESLQLNLEKSQQELRLLDDYQNQ